MDATKLAERLESALRVNRVYGDPVTVDGVTVLPAARVGGGGGGGTGRETKPAEAGAVTDADPIADRPGSEGGGGGLGWTGRPSGAFVIQNGQVRWQPAVDVNRLVTAAATVAIVALLTARTIVKITAASRR